MFDLRKEFGRVFDPRKEFGRVFDPRKEYGRVFDLRKEFGRVFDPINLNPNLELPVLILDRGCHLYLMSYFAV